MQPNWEKIEIGLKKYSTIMQRVNNTDVSTDIEFQKLFNGFYRMRQKPITFYKSYFLFLQQNKGNQRLDFYEILNHFKTGFGRIEASFSSKLLATVNPHYPVLDKEVLQNLGLRLPQYHVKDRFQLVVELYENLCRWHAENLNSETGKSMIREFDLRFPESGVAAIKKVDFILWQTREIKSVI